MQADTATARPWEAWSRRRRAYLRVKNWCEDRINNWRYRHDPVMDEDTVWRLEPDGSLIRMPDGWQRDIELLERALNMLPRPGEEEGDWV